MIVTSRFTSEYPAASTSRWTSSRKARLATPRQRGVAAREVAPHVALPRRPQQRVADGVQDAVAVGVALEAAAVGHVDPAEAERAPGHQAVGVEAVADANRAHARTSPARTPSAQARSSGVVIFRLRGEPGTARTGAPRRSTAIASSVRVTRSRRAAS